MAVMIEIAFFDLKRIIPSQHQGVGTSTRKAPHDHGDIEARATSPASAIVGRGDVQIPVPIKILDDKISRQIGVIAV